MSRFDRQLEAYRARAMQTPLTRANRPVNPEIPLKEGAYMGLSVNK